MTETNKRHSYVLCLVECAVMVALSFGLSCIKLWEMPIGGSVTLCSMLPIMLIGIKYGAKVGLGAGFVYSLTQLAQGFAEGDISAVSMEWYVFIIAMLFDYIVPFTALGVAGIFGKEGRFSPFLGMGVAVGSRVLCHYLTGVTIWAQWTPDGWSPWLYSAAYNGGYLLADLALTLVVAFILLSVKEIRKILGLPLEYKKSAKA